MNDFNMNMAKMALCTMEHLGMNCDMTAAQLAPLFSQNCCECGCAPSMSMDKGRNKALFENKNFAAKYKEKVGTLDELVFNGICWNGEACAENPQAPLCDIEPMCLQCAMDCGFDGSNGFWMPTSMDAFTNISLRCVVSTERGKICCINCVQADCNSEPAVNKDATRLMAES
jgi:hypothetical protein